MSKKILRCPRSILMARYDKPIDAKLIPKGAKLLSELNESQSSKIVRLFDYFIKNSSFKGSKRDLFIICEPKKEPTKWDISRNFEAIKLLSKIDFVLPFREKGEQVTMTNTRQIFILEEFRRLEGKLEEVEDLRIRSLLIIKPHIGTLEFFKNSTEGKIEQLNNSTKEKKRFDYVKLEHANLTGLKNKQVDFANRIFNFLNYEIKSKKGHTKGGILEIELKDLADKINALKTFKKDKKRFCARLKPSLMSIEQSNNSIKRIMFDEISENIVIIF